MQMFMISWLIEKTSCFSINIFLFFHPLLFLKRKKYLLSNCSLLYSNRKKISCDSFHQNMFSHYSNMSMTMS